MVDGESESVELDRIHQLEPEWRWMAGRQAVVATLKRIVAACSAGASPSRITCGRAATLRWCTQQS